MSEKWLIYGAVALVAYLVLKGGAGGSLGGLLLPGPVSEVTDPAFGAGGTPVDTWQAQVAPYYPPESIGYR